MQGVMDKVEEDENDKWNVHKSSKKWIKKKTGQEKHITLLLNK